MINETVTLKKEQEPAVDEYRIKIAFATPYYNWISVPFHQSMILIAKQFDPWGVRVQFFGVDRVNPVQARNTLMKSFMKQHEVDPLDWILHIDSDMVFSPHHVLALLRDAEMHKLPILSGVYFQKREVEGKRYPVVMAKRDGVYHCIEEAPKEGIAEAEAVGFGFLLSRPEVYKKLQEKHGDYVFEYIKTEKGMRSEDITWCERARDLGYRIHVDYDVKVGHYGVI